MSKEISDDQVPAAGTDDQVLAAGTDDQVLAAGTDDQVLAAGTDDQVPAAGTVVPDATGIERFRIDLSRIMKATKNFRRKNLIVEGSSAHIYKGKFKNGQIIAVKRFKPSSDKDTDFANELHFQSRLHHRPIPNTIRMLGFCDDEDAEEKLIVYEFKPLGSLFDHLHARRTRLDWDKRMRIATGVATVLSHLHKAHPEIVYRDLKPKNVLLGDGFHPWISDFRIARSTSFTGTSTVFMGTLPYWAPENAKTDGYSVSSDVYSFGALLLDMIIGYVPLDTSSLGGVVAPWVKSTTNFAGMVDPELARQFDENMIKKAIDLACLCMSKHVAVRPTMEEVVMGMRHISGYPGAVWEFFNSNI